MISIIMPVFNGEKYIGRAIDSVISQTYQDWELIIIDDGSGDNSAFVVQTFTDARIKYYKTLQQGVCMARNKGIELASGQYITFLDVDDYLHPQVYEKMIDAAKEVDVTVCGYYIESGLTADMLEIEEDNPYISYEFTHAAPKQAYYNAHSLADGLKNLLDTNALYPIWNKLFKSSIIAANNIKFNPALLTWGEDELFNYEYLRHCNSMSCLNYYGIYYSTTEPNALSYHFDDNRFQTELMLREHLISLFDAKQGYNATMQKQLAYVFCGKLILHMDNMQKNNYKATQQELLSHWEDIIQHDDVCRAFNDSGLASQFIGYMSRKYLLGSILNTNSFEQLNKYASLKIKPSVITDLLFAVSFLLDEDKRFESFNQRAKANGAKWIIDPNGF